MLRHRCRYVKQLDELPGQLTVQELMYEGTRHSRAAAHALAALSVPVAVGLQASVVAANDLSAD